MAMKAVKGERFYRVAVKGWDGLREEPMLVQGVVLGGGDLRILYQVDGHNTRESEKRREFERRVHATPEEAWWAAAREVDRQRAQALQELRKSVWLLDQIATKLGTDHAQLVERLVAAEEAAAKERELEPF